MSYQYHDRGGPYGIPNSDMAPSPGRRPPPGNYGHPDRPRPPPPLRLGQPGGAVPGGRQPVRPPQQQYAVPPRRPVESTENLYDGSAYGGAEESEQWPLPSRPFAESGRSNSPGGSPRGSPRRPPQRPQRPDYQEPMLDPPRQPARIAPANRAYHQPPPPQSYHGSGQWTGDGYRSPQPPYPPPNPPRQPPPQQPSHAPTPDYQTPQAMQQAVYGQRNQRPPLGPPPSARRGPANYYPQIAPVHPIAEEADSVRGSIRNASTAFDPAHSSYASSNAIPIGIPGYYLEDRGSGLSMPYQGRPSFADSRPSIDYRPSTESFDESRIEPIYETGRESSRDDRESPSPEPAALIRQASLGKKSKPTLTTVKSGEKIRKDSAGQGLAGLPSQRRDVAAPRETLPAFDKEPNVSPPSVSDSGSDDSSTAGRPGYGEKALEAGGAAAVGAAAVGAGVYAGRNDLKENAGNRTSSSDILSSGTGLLDPSSSESEKDVKKKPSKELLGSALGNEQQQRSRPRSRLAPVNPRVESVRGSALSPTESERANTPTAGTSERVGRMRPPRLDMDAVRDAEARGSLTSLPDLIKRATRLASNLDRGKTASRLGMNFFSDGNESDSERYRGLGADNRRSGSISDILASFPPPGLATPPGSRDGVRRSLTNWNSNLRHSHLPSDSNAGELRKKKRKCCGMPLWLFLLLLVIIFLLIAAAVVVPVVLLIVIPGQKVNSSGTTSAALASCQGKLTCHNGGTNIISSDGFCRCLCVNSYTGKACSTQSQAGCTTISAGSTTDATVGEDIPRLLSGAESNFSIPLDGETLLGLFSAADMSCNSENALVTFSNVARRSANLGMLAPQEPTPTIEKRRTRTATGSGTATTSNGIVFQSGTPSSNTGSSSSNSSSTTTLDFARVAILYIFQDSNDANTAATAQENLQSYFSSGETSSGEKINPKNVTLGNGYSCNLSGQSLSLSNGTTIGS